MPTYASFTGDNHAHSLTPGKRYLVEECATYFTLRDDADLPRFCQWSGCPHLCGGNWTRHDEPDAKDPEPTQMQIEEGKYYRTRDGRKVGPIMAMSARGYSPEWKWKGNRYIYRDDGSEQIRRDEISGADLVAEWSDPPTLLGDMTDAEIGALVRLLIHDVEVFISGKWFTKKQRGWHLNRAYRVKPEPVQEKVTLFRTPDGEGLQAIPVGTIDQIDGVFQPGTFKLL